MYVTFGSHGFYYRKDIGGIRSGPANTRASVPGPDDTCGNEEAPPEIDDQLVTTTRSDVVNELNRRARISTLPAVGLALLSITLGIAAIITAIPNQELPLNSGADPSLHRAIDAFDPFIENIRGTRVSSSDLNGHVVVANFVSQPCSQCPRETEAFKQLAFSLKSYARMSFLQLDSMTGFSTAAAHRRRGFSDLAVYQGADVATKLGIDKFPSVVIIDQTGRELFRIQSTDLKFAILLNAVLSATFVSGQEPPASSEIKAKFVQPAPLPLVLFLLCAAAMIAAIITAKRINRSRRTELVYELDAYGRQQFSRIQSAFKALSEASRIWEVVFQTSTCDWKRNAGCNTLVRRTPIRCGVMAIPNVSAGIAVFGIDSQHVRVFALPDMCLCWHNDRFAALKYSDITVFHSQSRFTECEDVPSDARTVGSTWRYVNKDGSPDRRFNYNSQLPVVLYADIALQFKESFQLNLQISSIAAAAEFVEQFTTGSHRQNAKTGSDGSQSAEAPAEATSEKTWAAEILGVNADASTGDITTAYRRLAQMYHPDKVASLAPEFQELADQKMKDVNRAYSILK